MDYIITFDFTLWKIFLDFPLLVKRYKVLYRDEEGAKLPVILK